MKFSIILVISFQISPINQYSFLRVFKLRVLRQPQLVPDYDSLLDLVNLTCFHIIFLHFRLFDILCFMFPLFILLYSNYRFHDINAKLSMSVNNVDNSIRCQFMSSSSATKGSSLAAGSLDQSMNFDIRIFGGSDSERREYVGRIFVCQLLQVLDIGDNVVLRQSLLINCSVVVSRHCSSETAERVVNRKSC